MGTAQHSMTWHRIGRHATMQHSTPHHAVWLGGGMAAAQYGCGRCVLKGAVHAVNNGFHEVVIIKDLIQVRPPAQMTDRPTACPAGRPCIVHHPFVPTILAS